MKICFLLPNIGSFGGVRAVFETGRRLKNKGIKVHFFYPFLSSKIIITPLDILRFLALTFIFWKKNQKQLSFFENQKYNDITRLFTYGVNLIIFGFRFGQKRLKRILSDYDIIITTSYDTVYPLEKLDIKARKFYFVQHYDIWHYWNSPYYWLKAEEYTRKHGGKIDENMALIKPKNAFHALLKKTVDRTYKIIPDLLITSLFLKNILPKMNITTNHPLTGIGNNFEIFSNKNEILEKSDKLIIIMPLRGIYWKGDSIGLKAIEQLYKKYGEKYRYILLGDGKKIKQPGIEQYSIDSDNLLSKYYNIADIGIFPSLVEGYGMMPVEAMASKTACVLTEVGAARQYTIDGETGLLCRPYSWLDIFQKTEILLQNEKLRCSIAKKAEKYVRQFTWDKTVNVFYNTLQQSKSAK